MKTAASSESRRLFFGTSEQVGWYFYDWANSAFSTTVVSVFLGPYLTAVTRAAADSNGFVYPLGIPVRADAFFPYMVSLSVLLQVLILPVMGAIVDYTHLKKRLMALFAYLGAFSTIGLYFLQGELYWLGGLLFLIANVSFGASIVCYNAFLPEIASPDERDRVSSVGWALGYLGGGLLLLLNLVFFAMRERFGVDSATAVRISLASAGMWWALFTLLPLTRLRSRQPQRRLPPGERYLTIGFKQLRQTLRELPRYPMTMLFLLAYLLYNDGIQTVIALSAQFGSEELGMSADELPPLFLMVQFVAFFGALFFGYLAQWIGAKRAILISLVIWTSVTIYAYSPLLQTGRQFFILGAVIALVLGGSQALSRSLFSQMIPKGQETEYFGLYEVSERGTSWLGPLIFGLAVQFTDSYRVAVLAVGIFFIAGMILLPLVDVRRAIIEAGNEVPKRI
ncbi:MFS transporter [Caldilinea sp.]|jgi:UMF1 family MFS transporter|uniref:MFS transporter n=1 Tax=Caldilinea sp. TaxID=2293560 RepID=UPI001B1E4CB1|nr:MFS transporter [Caldilinea sp.]MBO9392061.1 MFS transporter [Caldilinea sp.]